MDREFDKLQLKKLMRSKLSTGKEISEAITSYFKKHLKDSPTSMDRSLETFGGPLFTKQ